MDMLRKTNKIPTRFVIISKTPVNNVYFAGNVVDKHILGFNITVHDTTTMRIIQTLVVNENLSFPTINIL